MVVTAFMAGLALGSWGFGRWIDRQRNPLLICGFLEGGIAISAFLLPFLLGASEKAYTSLSQGFPDNVALTQLARFFLSFIPLLIPTTLMGATLPVMSKHMARTPQTIGADVGTLYSLNVLGAVVGAYLAGFHLIGRFGLSATVLTAVGLNVVAATLAFTLSRAGARRGGAESGEPAPVGRPDSGTKASLGSTRFMWTVFFVTGFTSLAFQILWTKGLALFVDNTVYSYAAMLATFLAGIGAGGIVWSRFLKWEDRLPFRLAVLQLAIGTYGAMTLLIFHGLARFRLADRLIRLTGESPLAFSLPYFATTIPVLFIPTFLMGLSFPLIVKILVQDLPVLGARLGQAYAVNTVGSIAGSLVSGFFLLPLLGIQKSILVVAAMNVGIGVLLVWKSKGLDRFTKRMFWAGVGGFGVLVAWGLRSEKPLILSTATFLEKEYGQRDLLFYKEDVAAVVTVRKTRTGEKLLEVNGKSVAGTAYEYENTQKMQGHLPILLFGKANRVLQVGFGSGGSLYAISRHREIRDIHCVEICDSVMEAASFFKEQNHDILNEPRLRVIHDDAVNYIRKTNQKYDLIMSDSIHPTYAGNGALYSSDYFTKCKERLTPGGRMSFWFPLYSLSQEDYRVIMRSFVKVFPHASLWYVNTNVNPYTLIVGSEEPFRVDVDRLARDFNDPWVAEDLRLIGIETPYDLLNCFIMAEEALSTFCGPEGALNTDQHPIIEFSVPRLRKIGREGSWLLNFQDVVRARTPVTPFFVYEDPPVSRQAVENKMRILFEGTGPLLDGQISQLAGSREAAMASYEKALSLNPESSGAKTLIGYLYREKAERFRREKKFDRAIESYERALHYEPQSPKSHNNMGTLYLTVARTDLAEIHFQRAIDLDATYVTPRLNLGFLYRDAGQLDRAAEQFRAAHEIDPTNAIAAQELNALKGHSY